jgi:hypothetical protein
MGSKKRSNKGLFIGIGCAVVGIIALVLAIPVGLAFAGAFYFLAASPAPNEPYETNVLNTALEPVDVLAVPPEQPPEAETVTTEEPEPADEEAESATTSASTSTSSTSSSSSSRKKKKTAPAPEPEPEAVVEEEPSPPVDEEEDPEAIDALLEDFTIEDLDDEEEEEEKKKKKKKKRGR